jgi:flagellar biosynthesis protein
MSDSERARRQRAIALRYKAQEEAAPKIVAKGAGLLAERILQIARENKIHIHEDPDLVTLLAKLEVNTPIPEELYRAVAEVLAVVYRLNKRM